MKRLFHLVVLSVLLASAAVRGEDFFLSYWCGPIQSEDLDKRHAEVAECGFTYAMPPCAGVSPAQNKKTLEACKKHKLKYIVNDARILKFEPSDPAFKTNLNAVIADYSSYEALGGYFLTDEPGPGLFPKLAAIHQHFVENDPKRLPFINLYPNYAPAGALGGTYEQHVEKFITTVKPRLLCFDHYALLNKNIERPIYFDNLEVIRRQGLKHNVPIGFIFQMTAHFDYRELTEDELRWQANTGLAYGTKALLYFTYWSPTNDPAFRTANAIINNKGERSPHYEMAKRINHEIRAWAPTLMKLTSKEVYHTTPLPRSTRPLPSDAQVQLRGDGEYIVSLFQHEDGSEWLMIMNRNMRRPARADLIFDKSVKKVRELSNQNGKISTAKMKKQVLPVQLTAGGAKLFRLSN